MFLSRLLRTTQATRRLLLAPKSGELLLRNSMFIASALLAFNGKGRELEVQKSRKSDPNLISDSHSWSLRLPAEGETAHSLITELIQ